MRIDQSISIFGAYSSLPIHGEQAQPDDNDLRGNMATRSQGGSITHNYAFDVEGRLISVTMGTQKTTFAYDADGNRVLTVLPGDNPTRIYTPFPDYEMEDPPTGDNITRTTYRLAGQMVAVQKRVGTGAGTFAYTYSDHLGNLVGLSSLTGVLDATSLARYDPFGNFRTTPATNPGTTNHGFTGHRHNNTGTNNLGLIYMNARYYLPEVGRFVSPDTIVPEPGEPQSHNRYAYAYNDPVNLVDPSGHCINNYEIGSADMDTCVAAWNAVMNYMDGVFFGTGDFPDAAVNDWLMNADISLLEKLMESWGISYGYTWTPPQGYIASGSSGGKSLTSPEFTAGMCDYWQSCYDPLGEYGAIGATVPLLVPFGPSILLDDWGNVYFNLSVSSTPGVAVYVGDVKVTDGEKRRNVEDLAVDQQEAAVEEFLVGWSDGVCAALMWGGCFVGNSSGNHAWQGGVSTPGISISLGYTVMIYDAGEPQPWFYQRWFGTP